MDKTCLKSVRPLKKTFEHLDSIVLSSSSQTNIGRALTNDVIIKDVVISRQHCTFSMQNGKWFIKDTSSAGILVNNKNIIRNFNTQLNDGDRVQLDVYGELLYVIQIAVANDIRMKVRDMRDIFDHSQTLEKDIMSVKIKTNNERQNAVSNEIKEAETKHEEALDKLNKNYLNKVQYLKGNETEREHQKKELFSQVENEKKMLETQFKKIINELEKNIDEHKNQNEILTKEYTTVTERLNNERQIFVKQLGEVEQLKQEKIEELEKKLREKDLYMLKEKERLEKETIEIEKKTKRLMELELEGLQKKTLLDQQENKEKIDSLQKKFELEKNASKDMELNLKKNYQDKVFEIEQIEQSLLEKETALVNEKEHSKKLQEKLKEKEQIELSNPSVEKKVGEEISNLMESELLCVICQEYFIKATTLNCSHSFCEHCLKIWKRKSFNCPICRAVITSENQCLVIDSVVESMLTKLDDDVKNKRAAAIKEREKEASLPCCKKRKTSDGIISNTFMINLEERLSQVVPLEVSRIEFLRPSTRSLVSTRSRRITRSRRRRNI